MEQSISGKVFLVLFSYKKYKKKILHIKYLYFAKMRIDKVMNVIKHFIGKQSAQVVS